MRLIETLYGEINYLLHEEDEDFPEDLDKVNEEIQGVGDKVLVTIASLPDDDLGVEHDEPTEDGQANVEMSLEEKLGPEEDVCQAEDEESGEAGHEGAAEIEILALSEIIGGDAKDDLITHHLEQRGQLQ